MLLFFSYLINHARNQLDFNLYNSCIDAPFTYIIYITKTLIKIYISISLSINITEICIKILFKRKRKFLWWKSYIYYKIYDFFKKQ